MSEKKKSKLMAGAELGLIAVLALVFMVWSLNQCNKAREAYKREAALLAGETAVDSTTLEQKATPKPEKASKEAEEPQEEPTSRRTRTITEKITPLYVSIDNLKLREKPNLQSRIIRELELFEEVSYLHEMTDFKQKINLGSEIANEPWVKVKTERGYIGWVYAAGVHFYKKKREPIEKPPKAEVEEASDSGQ